MRILALNSEIPFPPVTGGQSRTFHLLQSLAAEHDLTLACFSSGSSDTPFVCPFPMEVVSVPYELPEIYKKMHSGLPLEWQAAYRQLSCENGEPWFVSCYDSPAMESLLNGMKSRSFDLILIEHSFMARFLPVLPADVPKIFDMHNVHTRMAWRRAQETSGPGEDTAETAKEFERTRSFERLVSSACQLCLCCSEQDAEAARSFLDIEHVKVIPNGVDAALMTFTKGPATPGYLLFTGMMNYAPNVEAVRYFVAEVLPLIHDAAPEVTFHIAGANPTTEVRELACGNVFVHGFVDDMRPYFCEASVVVVPLLHGGGTRLKILDAAACGRPIVSTSLGAEGLNLVDGRDILLADSASGFAQAVVALLSDAGRQRDLSQNARRAAEEYDWLKIGCEFSQAVRDVVRRGAEDRSHYGCG